MHIWNCFTSCLVVTADNVGSLLGELAVTPAASVDSAVDYTLGDLAAMLSTSVVLDGICIGFGDTCTDAGGMVVTFGMAASFTSILLLLMTTFGVWTTYEWGISALDRTYPGMHHFLVWKSCNLPTDCVGRSWGSSLVVHFTCSSLGWTKKDSDSFMVMMNVFTASACNSLALNGVNVSIHLAFSDII